jgi:pyruvate formate lyase activating enzyme
MSVIGFIFDIKKYSINDGPGIRTTIFFKGCPLNCWWCHNPESQRNEPEEIENCNFRWNLYNNSTKRNVIGTKILADEVIAEIKKDLLFYEESKGGATFSGGEPMLQFDFLNSLLTECRRNDIGTAIDTTGYAPFESYSQIYDLTDLFLFDLKLMDDALHYQFCGVSNSLIHENLKKLTKFGDKVILRIPIIPTITDTEENISAMISLISSLNKVRGIDLLPFHNTAKSKYERMKKENKVKELIPPTKIRMQELQNRFKQLGIPVHIGG